MARLTRERNLRTGRSLWTLSPGLGVPVRPLTEAIAVDVAVVGAGVSGALMARELARDHTVAVLDRRAPLMGSTIASTALIQWEIDRSLVDLGRRVGPARARRAYARSYAGVAALREIVAEDRIRCGLQPRATLYVAGDLYGARALEEEAAARAELGLPSRFVAAEELRERFAVPRTGAILSEGSACADPGRLTAGLLRRAIDRRSRWRRLSAIRRG
ncbi:FAD-dependent oxidoreductase [Nannocystis bainbridge]|uniref:FAD-dependent oxidoreductase n=1 Tax=Nannocystis bainbridge TaxID=2995303 RepID=A0ABT5DWG1_9BACT|nr:FAD-dependent oxidoreductase [Nannocystis bainbridge]MDC0716746.1 FAD-dependent oxidoreductase [Nannocystis bainbridge]